MLPLDSSIPILQYRVEAGPSYACSLQLEGSERARWTLPGPSPAELREAFQGRYIGGEADDGRSGPESLDELARLCRDCLPGPLIDERRLDHLEERLKAAGEPGAPPLVLSLDVGDELRTLPLEAGQVDPDFEREGVRSVCLDDRVVLARRGSGPSLVADSELRVLVVDCGEGQCLETETLKRLCGVTSRVTVLPGPTYAELTTHLAEDRDHNVLVTIGHVERTGSRRPGSMTFADGQQPSTDVASLVARTLPELKVLVLGGCESWSSLAPAFEALTAIAAEHQGFEPVLTSVPVLVAHHFKIAPGTERGAVRALLRELGASGRVDAAFRAYRGALGQDDVCDAVMRSSAVLRLNGNRLELTTPDPQRARRLRYARAIERHYSRVRLPVDAKRDIETRRSRGGYLERDVSHSVEDRDSGQGRQPHQVREHELSILNRLLSGECSVVGLKAPAGVGKTALVHNVAYRLATRYLHEGSGPLPVCVELREFGTSLKDLVESSLTEGLTLQDLNSAGYVLLADGLDEAVGKDRLLRELKALPHSKGDIGTLPVPSASLVSSRPESASRDLPHFGRDRGGSEKHIYELEPWDLERIGQYIERHFQGPLHARGDRLIEHIKGNPVLLLLSGQPLLLWLLCGQAESTPIERLPTTATSLLEVGISQVLRRRNEHIGSGQAALDEADLVLIAELCWARSNSDTRLSVRDARRVLRRTLEMNPTLAREVGICGAISRTDIDDLPHELVARSGLLTANGSPREGPTMLSPSDERFGEFLVARHVATAVNAKGWDHATVEIDGQHHRAAQWISSRAWLPEMLDTLAYIAGQLDDPDPMLRELATEEPTQLNKWGDDDFRYRLSVAARCVGELGLSALTKCRARVDCIATSILDLWLATILLDHRRLPVDHRQCIYAAHAWSVTAAGAKWHSHDIGARLADLIQCAQLHLQYSDVASPGCTVRSSVELPGSDTATPTLAQCAYELLDASCGMAAHIGPLLAADEQLACTLEVVLNHPSAALRAPALAALVAVRGSPSHDEIVRYALSHGAPSTPSPASHMHNAVEQHQIARILSNTRVSAMPDSVAARLLKAIPDAIEHPDSDWTLRHCILHIIAAYGPKAAHPAVLQALQMMLDSVPLADFALQLLRRIYPSAAHIPTVFQSELLALMAHPIASTRFDALMAMGDTAPRDMGERVLSKLVRGCPVESDALHQLAMDVNACVLHLDRTPDDRAVLARLTTPGLLDVLADHMLALHLRLTGCTSSAEEVTLPPGTRPSAQFALGSLVRFARYCRAARTSHCTDVLLTLVRAAESDCALQAARTLLEAPHSTITCSLADAVLARGDPGSASNHCFLPLLYRLESRLRGTPMHTALVSHLSERLHAHPAAIDLPHPGDAAPQCLHDAWLAWLTRALHSNDVKARMAALTRSADAPEWWVVEALQRRLPRLLRSAHTTEAACRCVLTHGVLLASRSVVTELVGCRGSSSPRTRLIASAALLRLHESGLRHRVGTPNDRRWEKRTVLMSSYYAMYGASASEAILWYSDRWRSLLRRHRCWPEPLASPSLHPLLACTIWGARGGRPDEALRTCIRSMLRVGPLQVRIAAWAAIVRSGMAKAFADELQQTLCDMLRLKSRNTVFCVSQLGCDAASGEVLDMLEELLSCDDLDTQRLAVLVVACMNDVRSCDRFVAAMRTHCTIEHEIGIYRRVQALRRFVRTGTIDEHLMAACTVDWLEAMGYEREAQRNGLLQRTNPNGRHTAEVSFVAEMLTMHNRAFWRRVGLRQRWGDMRRAMCSGPHTGLLKKRWSQRTVDCAGP